MAQQPSPKSGGKVSRRDFIKLMAAAGTVMTFAASVDWGKFLPNPTGQSNKKQNVELSDCSVWSGFIFGVSGNTGPKKEEKRENVRVMEVCMILLLVKHLRDPQDC